AVRVTGDLEQNIQNVAVLGGSGEKYIKDAQAKGADVLITGDITFHQALDAKAMGMCIIDPGHHVEKIMKEGTKKYLEHELQGETITVITSTIHTEPFTFVLNSIFLLVYIVLYRS